MLNNAKCLTNYYNVEISAEAQDSVFVKDS